MKPEKSIMANTSGNNKSTSLDKKDVREKGLNYCRERLSSLGWHVTDAADNELGIDFIARNKDDSRFVKIKVRTLSKHAAASIGSSLDKVVGDFWVVVTEIATTPSAFVLPSQEVKKVANRDKGGERQYWLETRDYRQEKFHEAWEQIGRGDA